MLRAMNLCKFAVGESSWQRGIEVRTVPRESKFLGSVPRSTV